MRRVVFSEHGQAMPDGVAPFGREAFDSCSRTEIRWLGSASVMIRSRETVLMIDPVLTGFDLPLLASPPLSLSDIPRLDGVLMTHIDSDHYSPQTCAALRGVCASWHATHYVAEEMRALGLPAEGHEIHCAFSVGEVRVRPTPADHCWQRYSAEFAFRAWSDDDCCGYWLDTPDGSVWLPGDSRLMDAHLHMPAPDVLLLDFSDDSWHITLDGAVRLADAYPRAELIAIHWGTYDAPNRPPFNANPLAFLQRVSRPERVHLLRPGEAFALAGR